MTNIEFITNVQGNILWRVGNYLYQIQYKDGHKELLNASYEEAMLKIKNCR